MIPNTPTPGSGQPVSFDFLSYPVAPKENAVDARASINGTEIEKQFNGADFTFTAPVVQASTPGLITMLRGSSQRAVTKVWVDADTKPVVVPDKTWPAAEHYSVSSLIELFDAVKMFAAGASHSLLRYVHKARLSAPNWAVVDTLRNGEVFEDIEQPWMMVDVDGFRPAHSDYRNLAEATKEYITTKLPAEFHTADFFVGGSSSYCMPGKEGVLKAHIFFWLSTPLKTAVLSQWSKSLPKEALVDTALYNTVQQHFIANPVFLNGIQDPVAERWVFVKGQQRAVSLHISEEHVLRAQQKAERAATGPLLKDPREKPGVIGAFHKVISLEDLLFDELADDFARDPSGGDRHTWLKSDSQAAGSVIINPDRMHVGANNNSWPFGSDQTANLFDVLRVLKFGHLDEGQPHGTPIHKLPSYTAAIVRAKQMIEAKMPGGLQAHEQEFKAKEQAQQNRLFAEFAESKEVDASTLPALPVSQPVQPALPVVVRKSFDDVKAEADALGKGATSNDIEGVLASMLIAGVSGINEEYLLKAIKQSTGVGLKPLRKALDDLKRNATDADESQLGETHAAYARQLLLNLQSKTGYHPVAGLGKLFAVDSTNIWRPRSHDDVSHLVMDEFDGKKGCVRTQDYTGVAKCALTIAGAGNEGFFDSAPTGVACPDGTLFLLNTQDGNLSRVHTLPEHRQRFSAGCVPVPGPAPMFEKFLLETFHNAADPDECDAQIALLQEIMGCTLFALLAKSHVAVVFKGASRAGKGVLTSIISKLVPSEWCVASDPMNWDNEGQRAVLAGARLNLVGELPQSNPVPAHQIKKILGGDPVDARFPYGQPFKFVNEATHIFSTNHHINTRERDQSFFSRWVMLEFKNTMLEKDKVGKIDSDLAGKIVASELGQIMYWAMLGAQRFVRNGKKLSLTKTHFRMLDEWRGNVSPILEFLQDTSEFRIDTTGKHSIKQPELFNLYSIWRKNTEHTKLHSRKSFIKELEDMLAQGALPGVYKTRHADGDVLVGLERVPKQWRIQVRGATKMNPVMGG